MKEMTGTSKSVKDSRKKKRQSLTWTKKYESKIEEIKGSHVDTNQGKVVITGFHSKKNLSQRSYNS